MTNIVGLLVALSIMREDAVGLRGGRKEGRKEGDII